MLPYRKSTRKDYLKYTRCRKHTAKMTRKAMCGEKRESRWSLARSRTSVSLTGGRGRSAVLLTPTMRQEMAERFRAREGHYHGRILADKIYRNREDLGYCKAHGIRLSCPTQGQPKKSETRDKAQDYRDGAGVWKWSAASVLRSANAAWVWSLQSCRRLRPV